MAANAAHPRRRWLKFSLRSVLLAMTLFCIWLGFKVGEVRRQHEAVSAIRRASGWVTFDYELEYDPADDCYYGKPNWAPPGPAWLRRFLGEEYFRVAIEAGLNHSVVAESDLAQLAKLPKLWFLTLTNTKTIPLGSNDARPFCDADLVVLSTLTELRHLAIARDDISGSGLVHLANLKHLRHLDLGRTKIDDAAMKHIGRMTSLEELELDATRITDDGLKELRNLNELKHVDLRGTSISDAGLRVLGGITTIDSLYLSGTRITDDGLQHLKSLPLVELDLPGTEVSDAGLRELEGITTIKWLSSDGTRH